METKTQALKDEATGRTMLKADLKDLFETCGNLTEQDYRDAYLHLNEVAHLNEDDTGAEILLAVLTKDETKLPAEIIKSLGAMFNEFVAAGKEITLRKVSRVLDPEGKFIDVPDDWYGKGEGVGDEEE